MKVSIDKKNNSVCFDDKVTIIPGEYSLLGDCKLKNKIIPTYGVKFNDKNIIIKITSNIKLKYPDDFLYDKQDLSTMTIRPNFGKVTILKNIYDLTEVVLFKKLNVVGSCEFVDNKIIVSIVTDIELSYPDDFLHKKEQEKKMRPRCISTMGYGILENVQFPRSIDYPLKFNKIEEYPYDSTESRDIVSVKYPNLNDRYFPTIGCIDLNKIISTIMTSEERDDFFDRLDNGSRWTEIHENYVRINGYYFIRRQSGEIFVKCIKDNDEHRKKIYLEKISL
jgi:hypothetical protein